MVKEAICLFNAGYNVTVLYSFWTLWADEPDIKLKKEYASINWIRVGGHPKDDRLNYLYSRFVFKILKLFSQLRPFWKFKKYAINRTSYALYKKANSVKANLYIAHSLGALPAVINAAKQNNAKASIDFEDHFSGQWDVDTKEYNLYKWIEDNFIPKISFCTAASPLIADKYMKDYPFLSPLIINNVFSKIHLLTKIRPYKKGETLKLFWFSQKIGKNRGIEELIKAIGKLNGNISCTLLGSIDAEMKKIILKIARDNNIKDNQITFLEPVSLKRIFLIASDHHIGFAIEPGFSINNNIALSNKIFTYLLSGLAIIATNTSAQQKFLEKFDGIGNFYPKGNSNELKEVILKYQNNPDLLQQHRLNALNLAKEKLNWEEEQKKYLVLIHQNII
ncbi:MAG: hypothetical protein NTX08_03120 [Sphingobacteriales bacterium]|nr:hypothetical protein [Sphingobacteriales bacterium]